MQNINTNTKITTEIISVDFDFTSSLAIGETISSAAVTALVFSGTDATPSAIISGSASVSGAVVSQTITGGVAGVVYLLNCAVVTSSANDLIIQTKLATISSNPF